LYSCPITIFIIKKLIIYFENNAFYLSNLSKINKNCICNCASIIYQHFTVYKSLKTHFFIQHSRLNKRSTMFQYVSLIANASLARLLDEIHEERRELRVHRYPRAYMQSLFLYNVRCWLYRLYLWCVSHSCFTGIISMHRKTFRTETSCIQSCIYVVRALIRLTLLSYTFPSSESQLLRMSLQITISRVRSIHLFQVFALELIVSSDVKYAEENEPWKARYYLVLRIMPVGFYTFSLFWDECCGK